MIKIQKKKKSLEGKLLMECRHCMLNKLNNVWRIKLYQETKYERIIIKDHDK